MNEAKIVGATLLVGVLLGTALGYTAARKLVPPERVTVHDVELVEKKVYITKDQTVTRPDGTVVVTHTVTEGSTSQSTPKEGKKRYNLGMYYLTEKTISGTVGARVGDLPVFIQGAVQADTGGRDVKFGLGLQLEF